MGTFYLFPSGNVLFFTGNTTFYSSSITYGGITHNGFYAGTAPATSIDFHGGGTAFSGTVIVERLN
jgi:hypothetical protein